MYHHITTLEEIATLPPGVTTLDLSMNNLHNKSGEDLRIAFSGIPESVTTLDLTGNGLHMPNPAKTYASPSPASQKASQRLI